jgi:hypothetical protein
MLIELISCIQENERRKLEEVEKKLDRYREKYNIAKFAYYHDTGREFRLVKCSFPDCESFCHFGDKSTENIYSYCEEMCRCYNCNKYCCDKHSGDFGHCLPCSRALNRAAPGGAALLQ